MHCAGNLRQRLEQIIIDLFTFFRAQKFSDNETLAVAAHFSLLAALRRRGQSAGSIERQLSDRSVPRRGRPGC